MAEDLSSLVYKGPSLSLGSSSDFRFNHCRHLRRVVAYAWIWQLPVLASEVPKDACSRQRSIGFGGRALKHELLGASLRFFAFEQPHNLKGFTGAVCEVVWQACYRLHEVS